MEGVEDRGGGVVVRGMVLGICKIFYPICSFKSDIGDEHLCGSL